MPSTPNSIKMAFRSNSYNRVTLAKTIGAQQRNKHLGDDAEPLQDGKQIYQNGTVPQNVEAEYINYGCQDQMEIQGYIRDRVRTIVSWTFIFFTLGALRLVFHWWPHWMLYATHRRCSLDVAERVLVIERYQQTHKSYYVKNVILVTADSARAEFAKSLNNNKEDDEDNNSPIEMDKMDSLKLSVHMSGGVFKDMAQVRMFRCKKVSYIWDSEKQEFYKLRGLDDKVSTSLLHQQKGLSFTEHLLRLSIYGPNEINVPMRGIVALLCLEVLNPFYIFQLFSFVLWMVDGYVYYALAILGMSVCSITAAVVQTRRNQKNLWSRVYSSDVANVLRIGLNGEQEIITVPTEQLAPGDVLVVPSHGCTMQCDAVLLQGNCIVNESLLTGESVPVTKTPLPNSPSIYYSEKEHARHTLFCGTRVIQTRYYGKERVYAVVVRTSFSTAKGNLVRSILYPPPVDFKFERDSYKFVQVLSLVAAVGVVYTVVSKLLRGHPLGETTLEALDLITIVVPPALPAAMTVGRMYAQGRLEKANVYCISPRTINVAGSINCVCFDKTGTLTEDGMDMWGAVPVLESKFVSPIRDMGSLPGDHLLRAMATCHSLTIIEGQLAGDPLDLKMFESTGWDLEEPEVSDDTKFDLISPTVVKPKGSKKVSQGINDVDPISLEVGIIRQFPFSSTLQRMSVITRKLGAREFTLYCKGSPEMVTSLCIPGSIPDDFEQELEIYTREGYRVLGVAYKTLPTKINYVKMQRLSREDAESNLTFLGLIVMENRLKPQTTGILDVLSEAKIRSIMVTGDNMLTALSVARDCGIVPHGQRVIMVHPVNKPDRAPSIIFTQLNSPRPTPAEPSRLISELSQLTAITGTESVASITSIESVSQMNGRLRESLDLELPLDTTVIEMEEAALQVTDNMYSFAITGSTWMVLKEHYPDLMKKVVTRGAVFARMSPEHKQQLIQELQALDYYVAMVGDGANDCGALKAAHAGISLSEAESSVASPFTSREPDICCVVELIRQGRSALVTSFSIFKYMAAYSLMQFASVIILYTIDSNLTDIEFLYIDLFVITTFAFVLGRVDAYRGPLFPKPPMSSLVSFVPILSLVGQMIVAIGLQVFSFIAVQKYDWYTPYNATAYELGTSNAGYENYAVFSVSSFQYIILAVVFSKGAPYRASFLTNPCIMATTFFVTGFTLYLTICPFPWLVSQFEMALPSDVYFRITLSAVAFINLILAVAFEFFCDNSLDILFRSKQTETADYQILDQQMSADRDWPPLSLESPPPEVPPEAPRPTPTVTLITSPNNRKRNSIGVISNCEMGFEDKYATPMRSVVSLMMTRQGINQSEDSLSVCYMTPPSTPGSVSWPPSPLHLPNQEQV